MSDAIVRAAADLLPVPVSSDDVPITPNLSVMPAAIEHATHDAELVRLWLHGRGVNTRDAYARDVARLFVAVPKELRSMTLGDLQTFADSLADLAPSSQKRILSAAKSLFTFAQKLGYVQFNVGAAVIIPKPKNTIAERILSERQVMRMIELETDHRNQTLLILLYASGGRVSEICGLCWRDCQPRKKGGTVTLYGKGQKTRTILLKAETFVQLLSLRGTAGPTDPVFPNPKTGKPLTRQHLHRLVQRAARRAGIRANVSPHWLRHAHGSHALDNNAPIHLVQTTLGHASLTTTSMYAHANPDDSSARYLPV